MPITVVSVAKSYSNRGNHQHRPGTKKRWYLYYINEDGKFRTRRINALEALFYKGLKTHRYQIRCPECNGVSVAFVRSLKGDVECPHCGCMVLLDDLDIDDASEVKPLPPAAAGKRATKLPPDPRPAITIGELEEALRKVVNGLSRLDKKIDSAALEKIRNLSADTIREAGIRPSDLAKLPNSLSSAGNATLRFTNDFHHAPGFERVLLGWAKGSYWNTRLKKPAWVETKSFRNGTNYVMKYATTRLDPKHVLLEWPASITDTKWGEEVFARHVLLSVALKKDY